MNNQQQCISSLRSLCFLYMNDKYRDFYYKVLDNLDIGKMGKRKDTEQEDVLDTYLVRRYKMSYRDRLSVKKYLGKKFKKDELKKLLGMNGGKDA